MTQFDSGRENGHESIDLEPRTERALTECMTVLPDAPGMYEVVGENSNETYTVDLHAPACTCNDFQYRAGQNYDAEAGCKHIRRVRFATGEEPIPVGVDTDPFLAEHTDETPRVAVTDGGIIEAGDEGEVLEESSERPDDCSCWDVSQGLPCFPCYREGFETPNAAEPDSNE
jgi:hypothetical protein